MPLSFSPTSQGFQPIAASRSRVSVRLLSLLCAAVAGNVLLAGCGLKTYVVNPTSGLPSSPAAASTNAYIGTQSPLNWSLTLDDKQNAYGYQSLPTDGSKAVIASGTFVPQSGFLNMGSSGLALEIPGVGALLRPGDNTTPPVAMVEQEGCLTLTGEQRYLLQGLVSTRSSFNSVIYRRGDLVADTTSDGKIWSFADAEYFGVNGSPISLSYQGQNSAGSFTGSCATTNGASSVSTDATDVYSIPTTFHFDAAGMVIADYTSATGSGSSSAGIGFSQPVLPISTKSLAAASFRGFQVEYSTTAITQPISFGPAADGSVALNGGVYPNDDVSQTPDSSTLFQFGSQNSSINGLFASATMTVLDPRGGCALNNVGAGDLGQTPNGVATCRLHLSAMVGEVGGKAFLVASGVDLRVHSGTAPDIQIYLIQQ